MSGLTNTTRFSDTVKGADIVSYAEKASRPILVLTLKNDSIYSPLNSENFFNARKGNEKIKMMTFENKNYRRCPSKIEEYYIEKTITRSVDHIGGELMSNVIALGFFSNSNF